MSRPQILISAFSCHPQMGSEPGLGYRYVRALAEHCDLTVITEELQNRAALEDQVARDPFLAQIDFRYIPWPRLKADGSRDHQRNFVLYYRVYREWQQQAFTLARQLISERPYDLAHHLTMTGYREPGFLWRLSLPFVWGPVGGFAMMPAAFLPTLGLRGAGYYLIRNVLNALQMRYSWRVGVACRKAAVIFASTSVDVPWLRRRGGRNVVLLGENGALVNLQAHPRTRKPGQPLKLLWSGLHIPRKALHIVIRALALVSQHCAVELHILGDGPERSRWECLARKLGVACKFYGWLKRDEALGVTRQMDALVLSSLQDATTSVLFESLSEGLPIIAHRCCGFQDALNAECAILVPLETPAISYRGFAEAIARLATDVGFYRHLSEGCLRHAQDLAWETRADRVLCSYREITGSSLSSSAVRSIERDGALRKDSISLPHEL